MELELAGRARLTHLNLRKEFHGEDVALGVDLRLIYAGGMEDLVHFGAALKALLYEGQSPRLPYLKPLQLTCAYEEHVLHISDMTFDGTTLSKFQITTSAEGHVEIAFNASISAVDMASLPALGALLLIEEVNIDIEPVQGELFKEPSAAVTELRTVQ